MIDNAKLLEILNSRLACSPALAWLKQRNSDEMWTQCERPNWLLWWVAPYVPRTELVRVVCQCARLALPHVAAGELRPLTAIETAEAWVRGEATMEEVKSAANAVAFAAYAANAVAYAAAIAAASAADVAQAADAADAADRASLTAHAAVIAAVEAAASVDRAAVQAQMCELIRQQWPTCPEPRVKG